MCDKLQFVVTDQNGIMKTTDKLKESLIKCEVRRKSSAKSRRDEIFVALRTEFK